MTAETPAAVPSEAQERSGAASGVPVSPKPQRGAEGRLTESDLEHGIANALKAGDMQAVVDMLHALAVIAPDRAGLILDAINLMSGPTS